MSNAHEKYQEKLLEGCEKEYGDQVNNTAIKEYKNDYKQRFHDDSK